MDGNQDKVISDRTLEIEQELDAEHKRASELPETGSDTQKSQLPSFMSDDGGDQLAARGSESESNHDGGDVPPVSTFDGTPQ